MEDKQEELTESTNEQNVEEVKEETTLEEHHVEVQPVEQTQQEEPKKEEKKKKSPLIFILILLVLAAVGSCCYFYKDQLFGKKDNEGKMTTKEKTVKSTYRMSGNDLQDFDLRFMQLENNGKNQVYSPLSIKYALAMLADGSNGQTKDQIVALIGDYKSKKYTNSANMSLANSMFIRDSFKNSIQNSYINGLQEKYNAEVVYDSFKDANTINNWVSDKTFKMIDKLLEDDTVQSLDFVLVNALAIDMEWNNLIQCASGSKLSCLNYNVNYPHEKYSDYVDTIMGDKYSSVKFNNSFDAKSAEIAASVNNYDIVKELGEENIRKTVGDGWDKHIAEGGEDCGLTKEEFLNQYIKDIDSNYKRVDYSTDFLFHDDENVKAFAKDLKTYDGTTLQYVGIMPKQVKLNEYIKNANAKTINGIIKNLKEMKLQNFEAGKVTHITGFIPFFNYDYELDLMNDLKSLGVEDVFDINKADLSNMLEKGGKEFIAKAAHKANIEFSNEGIKAAAATAMGGAGAAACPIYDYLYDVPQVEINLSFDNPYLYLIRDKDTGEVWFAGTVYEPTANK